MKNKWKTSFIVLLSVNISVFLILLAMVIIPKSTHDEKEIAVNGSHRAVHFPVQTNKKDLTEVVNYYLASEGLTGDAHYEIELAESVAIHGKLPVFNQYISMELSFDPEVLANGDMTLTQTEMKVGGLSLPVSLVLKLANNYFSLPESVEIIPDEKVIYIALSEATFKNDLRIQMNEFNLLADEIGFSLIVPTDIRKSEKNERN